VSPPLCRYATQAAKEEQERRRAQYQEQLKRQQEAEAARQQQQQQQQQQQKQEGTTPSQQQQQTPPQQQQTPSTPLASGNSTPDMGGSGSQLQIIGMSATLPNVDQVAAWLDAVLYQTDFRPVQLRQYIKLGRLVKDQQGQVRVWHDVFHLRVGFQTFSRCCSPTGSAAVWVKSRQSRKLVIKAAEGHVMLALRNQNLLVLVLWRELDPGGSLSTVYGLP
jgi:hypothetical protein